MNKKRNVDNSKAKEDEMLKEAMAVLSSKKDKVNNVDVVFGQSIGLSIQEIPDKRVKEYTKVKIQELIFQAQFGLLPLPFQLSTTTSTTTPPVVQRQSAPQNSQGSYYSNMMTSPHSPAMLQIPAHNEQDIYSYTQSFASPNAGGN